MEKVIVLSVAIIAWFTFTLWTIKKLWRRSDDPKEALFWAKVKLGGLFTTIGGSLLAADVEGPLPFSYWQQVGIFVSLTFAGMIWANYIGWKLFDNIFDQY